MANMPEASEIQPILLIGGLVTEGIIVQSFPLRSPNRMRFRCAVPSVFLNCFFDVMEIVSQ